MSPIDQTSPVGGSPAAPVLRPDAAIRAIGLKVGQEVQAKVAALLSDTVARLALPGGVSIETQMPRTLPLGATLTFTVQRDGSGGMTLATTQRALDEALRSVAAPPPQAQSRNAAAPAPPSLPQPPLSRAVASALMPQQTAVAPSAGQTAPAAPSPLLPQAAAALRQAAMAMPATVMVPGAGITATSAPSLPAQAATGAATPSQPMSTASVAIPAPSTPATAAATSASVAAPVATAVPAAQTTAAAMPAQTIPATLTTSPPLPAAPAQSATAPAPQQPTAAMPQTPAAMPQQVAQQASVQVLVQSQVLTQARPIPVQAERPAGAAVPPAIRIDALSLVNPVHGEPQPQTSGQQANAGEARANAMPMPQAETPQASPPKVLRETLMQAVRGAAPQQDSLAPLYANLAALARPDSKAPALPAPVQQAMERLLGLRLAVPDAAPPAGDKAAAPELARALAKAVQGSGVFFERHLATGQAMLATPASDIKAALITLKSALEAALPKGEPAARTAMPTADATAPKPAADGTQARAPAFHERPPLRATLPLGQPPAEASIRAETPPGEALATLSAQTDAALARITLSQVASMPDLRDGAAPANTASHVMVVEVPIRLGQETAIAQMRIERDDDDSNGRSGGADHAPAWTLRFSLDATPMGPVHAMVRMREEKVAVNLWAEEGQTAQRFQSHLNELQDALEGSAFSIEALHCQEGRPASPSAAPAQRPSGHLLDRKS